MIKAENVTSVFVRNRVNVIKKNVNIVFDYVENPADIASRRASVEQINNSELWWNGPNWLEQHHNEWETINEEEFYDDLLDNNPEINSTATQEKNVECLGAKCTIFEYTVRGRL